VIATVDPFESLHFTRGCKLYVWIYPHIFSPLRSDLELSAFTIDQEAAVLPNAMDALITNDFIAEHQL
jgi:hypothetical protein